MHKNKSRFARLGLESLEGRALPSAVAAAPAPVIGQKAEASLMPVQYQTATPAAVAPATAAFTYTGVAGPSAVLVGTNTKTGTGKSTGSVALALVRNRAASAQVGGPAVQVRVGYITTSSSATTLNPDRYHVNFTVRLDFRDAAGRTGSVTFYGTIDGTLAWNSSHLTATFAGTATSGQVTQRTTIGNNVYSVSLPKTFALNSPSQSPVSLFANVKVTPRV